MSFSDILLVNLSKEDKEEMTKSIASELSLDITMINLIRAYIEMHTTNNKTSAFKSGSTGSVMYDFLLDGGVSGIQEKLVEDMNVDDAASEEILRQVQSGNF
jgi:hypothetical protein